MIINKENYESYLIDYLHGELTPEEAKAVALFLADNAEAQEEFNLLQQTIITPELDIHFEDKQRLYKKEEAQGGLTVIYKRYFAIAAVLVGALLAIFFLMGKEEQTSYVKQTQEEAGTVKPVLPQPKEKRERTDEIIKSPYKQRSTADLRKNRNEGSNHTAQLPQEQNEPVEAMVMETPQEVYYEKQRPEAVKDSVPTYITKESNTPKQEVIPREDEGVANRSNSTRSFEWDSSKKPKLFRMINAVLGFSNKLKQKEEQLSNTQMTVMVGNKVLFNINN